MAPASVMRSPGSGAFVSRWLVPCAGVCLCVGAANELPRVKVVFSGDAGQTFGGPVQVDEGSPVGRVDVEVLAPALAGASLFR